MDMDMDMDWTSSPPPEVALLLPRAAPRRGSHERADRYPGGAPSASSASSSSSSSSSLQHSWSVQQSLAAATHMAVPRLYADQAGPSSPSSSSSSSGSSSSSSAAWSTRFMRRTSSSSSPFASHHSDALSPPPARASHTSSRSSHSHLSNTLPSCRSARYPILAVCETDDVTNASSPHPHRDTRPEAGNLRSDQQTLTSGGGGGGGGDRGRIEKSGDKVPRRDKQTMDYVIRSGIAGGVAGCVVSSFQRGGGSQASPHPSLF